MKFLDNLQVGGNIQILSISNLLKIGVYDALSITQGAGAPNIIIGNSNTMNDASNGGGIVIGSSATSTSDGISIGLSSFVGIGTEDGIAIGRGATVNGAAIRALAFGRDSLANADNAIAFGNYTTASQANTIILGNNSAGTKPNVGISTSTPTARLHIIGNDATSGNYSLKVENIAASNLLYVRNDGVSLFGSTVSIDGKDVTNYPISVVSAHATLTRLKFLNAGNAQTDIQIGNNNGTNSIYYGVNTSGNSFIDNRNGNLLFQNTGTTQMIFDSSGRLGIGSTSPSATLDVKGGSSVVLSVKQLSSSLPAMFQLLNDNDTTSFSVVAHNSLSATPNKVSMSTGHGKDFGVTLGSSPAGTFRIAREDGYTTPSFFIDGSNERIGLGTTSPLSKLYVNASIQNEEIVLNNDDITGSSYFGLAQSGGIKAGMILLNSNHPFIPKTLIVRNLWDNGGIRINGGSGDTNIMYFDTTTLNVGIGTINPTAMLHIDNLAANAVDILNIRTNFYNHSNFRIQDIGSSSGVKITSDFGYWGLGCDADLSTVRLNVKGPGSTGSTWSMSVRNSSDVYSLVVKDNGFISVNASNPAAYLDVNGDFATRSAASATAITADTNDLATAGRSFVRLNNTAAASKNVTGFADGVDGKRLVVSNVGADDIILTNQDAGSVAANRIITGNLGNNNTLKTNDTLELIYDGVTARWRVINHGA